MGDENDLTVLEWAGFGVIYECCSQGPGCCQGSNDKN